MALKTKEEIQEEVERLTGHGWRASAREVVKKRRTDEQLDPETQARMDKAVETARDLRGRPLVSGMAARRMGEQGLQQQFAAMSGAPSAQQFAATQKGTTMGGRILGQQGQQMVGEAGSRFGVGLRLAQARQQLESGQVLNALAERLKNLLNAEGIAMNEQQALLQAGQAAIAMMGQMDFEKKPAAPNTEMGDYVAPPLPPGQAYS
jgi:hypothetical protein